MSKAVCAVRKAGSSLRRKIGAGTGLLALAAATLLYSPKSVFAAQGLGSVGQNVGTNLKDASAALKYGAMVVGLALVIFGLKGMIDVQKHGQGTMGPQVIKIVVGVCLLGVGGFAAMGSTTLFGSDQATGINELGIN